jgi:acyl-CoA thioester hydrolase
LTLENSVHHPTTERLAPPTVDTPGPHLFHQQLRIADLDFQGHVNNVRFVEYFQEAQAALIDPHRTRVRGDGASTFVVAAHTISYHRQLAYRSTPIRVETTVLDIGRSKTVLCSRLRDDQHTYARTESVYVAYDMGTRSVRRLSEDEHDCLSRYQVEVSVPRQLRRSR